MKIFSNRVGKYIIITVIVIIASILVITQSIRLTIYLSSLLNSSTPAITAHLFYNQSRYDNYDATANANDDSAIATDKTAYLGDSSISTFANISSYSRGINGIMVDIQGKHPNITSGDFTFKVGKTDTPSNWTTAPAPTSVTIRSIGSSDRITLIWDDKAISNTWLQVTVAANNNTGLVTPFSFFFGNLIGDTGLGNSSITAIVNATDEIAVRSNIALNVPVTNLYDFNRNSTVSATDMVLARYGGALRLIKMPIDYDITLKSNGANDKNYGPATNDLARGELLRQAVKDMKSGDTLILGEGKFDMDCKNHGNLLFPDKITVTGKGMDKTHLFSNCWSDYQGSAFEVRNGNYSDLTFENQSPWELYEDGRAIEMYPGLKRTDDNLYYDFIPGTKTKIIEEKNPGPFEAIFDRVKFISNAWVIYEWNARGHSWIIRDSVIVSGRQGVSMMSGGGYFQNAYILRTKFYIDTMLSNDVGSTSGKVQGGGYGVMARGGNIKVEDSEFHMKCGESPYWASYVPRCVGITDGNTFDSYSSPYTNIEIINNRWFIDGNGSPDTYDILITNEEVKSKLKISEGCGSGPNCLIIKNW